MSALDPPEDAEGLPARSSPPSRALAAVLTALFGSGVGHAYLGRVRRALLWACLPLMLFALYCVAIARLRVGYGWLVPCVCALVLVRVGALVDVFLVARRELRSVSIWLVLLFWISSVAYAVLLALFLRTQVLEAFKIPSGSMEPALLLQDHVMVARRAFRGGAPKLGQLAVFTHPEHPTEDFIKRVIALPGDTVEVTAGHPSLNGWQVPYCKVGSGVALPGEDDHRGELDLEFLGHEAFLIFIDDNSFTTAQTWRVAPNEVFVMGDNRNNSSDSRTWFGGRGGGVPLENLIGLPLFIWLAFVPEGSVDWSRLNLALDAPHLPSSLGNLEPALQACLRARPAQTEPPGPS